MSTPSAHQPSESTHTACQGVQGMSQLWLLCSPPPVNLSLAYPWTSLPYDLAFPSDGHTHGGTWTNANLTSTQARLQESWNELGSWHPDTEDSPHHSLHQRSWSALHRAPRESTLSFSVMALKVKKMKQTNNHTLATIYGKPQVGSEK